jgi:hypothetical protein
VSCSVVASKTSKLSPIVSIKKSNVSEKRPKNCQMATNEPNFFARLATPKRLFTSTTGFHLLGLERRNRSKAASVSGFFHVGQTHHLIMPGAETVPEVVA